MVNTMAVAAAVTAGLRVRRCRLAARADETPATNPTGVTTAAAATGDVAAAAHSAPAHTRPPTTVGSTRSTRLADCFPDFFVVDLDGGLLAVDLRCGPASGRFD